VLPAFGLVIGKGTVASAADTTGQWERAGCAGSLERTRLYGIPCYAGKIQGFLTNQACFGRNNPCKLLN
jgi:hypothetical protein